MIDTALITQLITALIALIAAIKAVLEAQEKKAVIAFYDTPETAATVKESVVVSLPSRSYLMSDETKDWILAGEKEEDRRSLLQQIQQAEEARKVSYRIFTSRGYYDVEYGLIKGSGGAE